MGRLPRDVLSIPSGHPSWLALPVILGSIPGVRWLGQARREAEALAVAIDQRPQVLLVSDEVERRPSFPLLKALREAAPESRLIVLAATPCPVEKALLLLDLDVTDYLLWSELTDCNLIRSILEQIIVAGFSVRSSSAEVVFRAAYRAWRQGGPGLADAGAADANSDLLQRLSPREREVLALMTECSNKEIAARLGVGTSTVKTHVESILRKLEVDTRTAAVVKAHLWRAALNLAWLAACLISPIADAVP